MFVGRLFSVAVVAKQPLKHTHTHTDTLLSTPSFLFLSGYSTLTGCEPPKMTDYRFNNNSYDGHTKTGVKVSFQTSTVQFKLSSMLECDYFFPLPY